jgi:hypothetical protein
LAVSKHSLRYVYGWNLSSDWSTNARLQTDLLTLDSRSGEPKIDNGPPGTTVWGTAGMGPGTPVVSRKSMFANQRKGHEHELTNPRIASRKHYFRTDELSAVVAPSDTTRGACCWTPDAALAERARLRDIRGLEYLAMEALQYFAMRVFAPASQSLIISNKERLRKAKS